MLRLGHGYFHGGIQDELCPAITISCFEFNNLLVEIHED